MPSGKMAVQGGIGRRRPDLSKLEISLDQYIKRGHQALNEERKSEIAFSVRQSLERYGALCNGSPAITPTEMKKTAGRVITCSKRWTAASFDLESVWRENLFNALDTLDTHTNVWLWRTLGRMSDYNGADLGQIRIEAGEDVAPPSASVRASIQMLGSLDLAGIVSGRWRSPHGVWLVHGIYPVWREWTGRTGLPGLSDSIWPFRDWIVDIMRAAKLRPIDSGDLENLVRDFQKTQKKPA